jgi:glycosyltransferase involved in cell wall biosynthesis
MIVHSKIIVGIPAFNEERFIRKTLESLESQTFKDFIVFISDNGSTDLTPKICNEFMERDTRFVYHRHAKNLGAARNFHFLLENTDSPYFMWMGAHDILDINYLDEQVSVLDSNKDVGLAYSKVTWIDENDTQLKESGGGEFVFTGRPLDRYLQSVRGPWNECTAINGVFRRSVLFFKKNYNFSGLDHLILTRAQFFGRFHRTTKPIYIRRDFTEKEHDYMQRLTGTASKDKAISNKRNMWPLFVAQIIDFFSLPVSLIQLVTKLPLLLLNLHLAYRLFDPIFIYLNPYIYLRRFRRLLNNPTNQV